MAYLPNSGNDKMSENQQRCRLYLITPPQFEISEFIENVKRAFDGGDIACLQLRMKDENMKTASDDKIKNAAENLLPICKERKISLIINDSAKLAKETGADGVHIGEKQDGTVEEARAIMEKNMIIGASCYDSRDRAMNAGEAGADYVAFGAFYPTQTKTPKGHPTPEILEWWSVYTTVPCVAIGGIKPENAVPLIKAGADFIAVVTGVWNHEGGAGAGVKAYNDVINSVYNNQ